MFIFRIFHSFFFVHQTKKIAVALFTALILFGCQVESDPKALSDTPTELNIVASRLFASRTYENFLDRLDVSCSVRWINASELSEDALNSAIAAADGILLTGGADIHPVRYGQSADTSRCGSIDVERDALESRLLRAVDSLHLPLLGICRGMQFMNVHNGGTLHPHLPDVLGTNAHRAGAEGNSKDTIHFVQSNDFGAFLHLNIDSASSQVTSHHHQGVHMLAPNLISRAVAPDGLIEAIQRRDTIAFPCYIGVQWHPERSPQGQPHVEPIGRFFLNAAERHAKISNQKLSMVPGQP
mgnify:CR=1 FL=1